MSYILEALRKMERQRRRDAGEETWADTLTAGPEEEVAKAGGPGRWLVAASVFFGLAGIVAGFFLYHGTQAPETDPIPAARVERAPAASAPAGKPADPAEKTALPAKPEAGVQPLTLSELKATAPGKDEPLVERKSGPPGPQVPAEVSSADLPRLDRVIDLTARHRLSSTGEIGGRKFATLDREDYFVGDRFMGMLITDIQQDRVHLKAKGDGQRYVIIFRYR